MPGLRRRARPEPAAWLARPGPFARNRAKGKRRDVAGPSQRPAERTPRRKGRHMKLHHFLRTSTWGPVVLRAMLTGAALVVLGIVGAVVGSGPKREAFAAPFDVRAMENLPVTASLAAVGAGSRPPDAGMADASATDVVPAPSPAPPLPPPLPPRTITARATPEAPVYLNEADEAELRRLPGVGVKRATGILELRQRVGRFRRVEDLLRVKGVGRGTLRKWRPLVRVDPRPTA